MLTGDPDQVLHGLRLSVRHVITKHADCHGNEIWTTYSSYIYKWDHQSGKYYEILMDIDGLNGTFPSWWDFTGIPPMAILSQLMEMG
jgi:hypothetical protein